MNYNKIIIVTLKINDIWNLLNLFSTNSTFPKNNSFADYIYYNPEKGNGSFENFLIKDINDDIKIIENGKKEINQNFFNKTIMNLKKKKKTKLLINNKKKYLKNKIEMKKKFKNKKN